jgi:ABC-type polar amino acid transport system ATPase subunit
MQGFRLQEERPEVKAWTDMIALRNIPINKKEVERLRQYETGKEDEMNVRKRVSLQKKNSAPPKKLSEGNKTGLNASMAPNGDKMKLAN